MENPKYTAANKSTGEFAELISSTTVQPANHVGFSTRCVHDGQPPEPIHGSVNVPIHLTSTYAQKAPGQPYGKFDYTRCGNPTTDALLSSLASLEYGKYAQVFSSGCAATNCLTALLNAGDHIICCDDVYGGTFLLWDRVFMKRYDIKIDFVDMGNFEELKAAFKPNTKMVWIESPSNPTLKVVDIEAIVKLTKEINKDIITVVENTFASPYFQSPLLLGADISYHSLTKYIGGHSDLIAGGLITNDKDLYDRIYFNNRTIGTNQSPFDSFMILRGIKTLKIRMEAIEYNAMVVARYLESHPKVERVLYPGLRSHPQHELAKKQMRGFSGMVSFYIKGGRKEAETFLKSLQIFILCFSLGGVDSLSQYPILMTHAFIPDEQKKKLGINDQLIRLSLGVEDAEDLLTDVKQALEKS